MKRAKKTMVGGLMAAALTIGVAGIAQAFGPPPDRPHVTCDYIRIDPPTVHHWINVTLYGDIGPYHVHETVGYGDPTPHFAYFPKSAALLRKLALKGPVGYELVATWSLGKGFSQEWSGWIDCEDEHPTTTTTVKVTTSTLPATTTSIPTTSSTVPSSTPTTSGGSGGSTSPTTTRHLTIGTPKTICESCLLPPPAQAGARGVLPHTGSSLTWPLLTVSSAMLAAGLLLLAKSRKTYR